MAQAGRLREDFFVSAYTGDGVAEILEYLREDGDIMPWEEAKERDNALA